MTLVIEDQEIKAEQALSNLTDTCRSKATQISYVKGLNYYTQFIGIQKGAYDQLIDKDPKVIQQEISQYVIHLKRQTKLSSSSISAYLAALDLNNS